MRVMMRRRYYLMSATTRLSNDSIDENNMHDTAGAERRERLKQKREQTGRETLEVTSKQARRGKDDTK